jgi:glycosyltransferase involved in cell wall biosynthesis
MCRIGVLVVAYNAESTLATVLDRLPAGFRKRVAAVLVADDASSDNTYSIGMNYQSTTDLPLTVYRQPANLGYGGNQKWGYRWAIENELDVVVLLHGDGQYAPEIIETLTLPLELGLADAVFGSRMMTPGAARDGGMPTYKFIGNKILTKFENSMTGLRLTEWHSGYRAYRVDALADIAFDLNSNDFDFDTEIILQLHAAGKAIHEVPIPTYYGDEICYVNGMKYARDVIGDVIRFRAGRSGFVARGVTIDAVPYAVKTDPGSSHGQLLERFSGRPALRVLDLGCSDGTFGELLRNAGHTVTGVDVVKHDGVGGRLNHFIEADLSLGIPSDVGSDFDVVIAADVIEHVADPGRLLRSIPSLLAPDGVLLASIPNFAHWYPRARVGLGRFDYDRRGILDEGHLRFFTKRSFMDLVQRNGWHTVSDNVVGTPIDLLTKSTFLRRITRAVDAVGLRAAPTLFGYQFLFELRPT